MSLAPLANYFCRRLTVWKEIPMATVRRINLIACERTITADHSLMISQAMGFDIAVFKRPGKGYAGKDQPDNCE